MQIVTMVLVSLLPLIVVLWLIKKFTDIADDIRYLANRARIENGDELPTTNRWVAVVAIVLIILVVAYVVVTNNPDPLSGTSSQSGRIYP